MKQKFPAHRRTKEPTSLRGIIQPEQRSTGIRGGRRRGHRPRVLPARGPGLPCGGGVPRHGDGEEGGHHDILPHSLLVLDGFQQRD